MKLTDLQNSVIICLSQMTLLRWLTFLLGSLILNVTFLSWIFFFLLTIVFVLQWLSLHWEILICCLSFHWLSSKLKTRCFVSLYSLTIPMLIGTVFIIIWEMLHGRISLNTVVLLLLVNFVIRFRLELMYISLVVNIRSNLIHLHGFQLLVLLS